MSFFVEILLAAEGLLKIDATILVNVALPSGLFWFYQRIELDASRKTRRYIM